MTTVRARAKHARHPHDDAPDTTEEFRRIAALPDGPERDELRQEVVRAWMPMAGRLARNFRNRGESLEDLEQVAALGLVKAVSRYDPARGCAFESFAVPTIVGEVKRHFRDHMWGLHVPRRVQELRNRVRTTTRQLSHQLDGRTPSVAEIAEHSGLTEEEVRTGMEALESYSTLSLDAELPGADDGYALIDTLSAAEPGFDLVVYRESLKPRLRRLPERERRLLYLRFFCGMTQSRIAEQLGISQMHVSRLLSRTCDRLSAEVETERGEHEGEREARGEVCETRARPGGEFEGGEFEGGEFEGGESEGGESEGEEHERVRAERRQPARRRERQPVREEHDREPVREHDRQPAREQRQPPVREQEQEWERAGSPAA